MFLHASHRCISLKGVRIATFACHDKPHACAETDGEKKALANEGDGGPGSAPQSYVLAPIDGRLLYLRRGKDVRESEEQAVQEADVTLESISLHLSSAQPSLCHRKERHTCLQSCLSASSIFADASVRRHSPLHSALLLELMPKGAEDGNGVTIT